MHLAPPTPPTLHLPPPPPLLHPLLIISCSLLLAPQQQQLPGYQLRPSLPPTSTVRPNADVTSSARKWPSGQTPEGARCNRGLHPGVAGSGSRVNFQLCTWPVAPTFFSGLPPSPVWSCLLCHPPTIANPRCPGHRSDHCLDHEGRPRRWHATTITTT